LNSFSHYRRYEITFFNKESQDHKKLTFFLLPEFQFDTGNRVFSESFTKIILSITSRKIINFNLIGSSVFLSNTSAHEKEYGYTITESDLLAGKLEGTLSCSDDMNIEEKKDFKIQINIPVLEAFKEGEKVEITNEYLSFDKLTNLSVKVNRNFNIMKVGFFKTQEEAMAITYQILHLNKQNQFRFKELDNTKSSLPIDEPVYMNVKFSNDFHQWTNFMPIFTIIREAENDDW